MPELPEVENVRRSLIPHLVGHTLTEARLLRADVCTTENAATPTPADLLQGATVRSIERRGKQLAVVADTGRVLNIHLGMSGQVLVRPANPTPEEKHVHAVWTTAARSIIFKDPRRFGGLWTFSTFEALLISRWRMLGPDALDADPLTWVASLRRGRRCIKATLLDQSVVAGIGNIYADEALHRAGVHPATLSHRLSPARASALGDSVRRVLAEAVEAGGSTLRDYRNADGVSGRQQEKHLVYGRSGERCLACSAPLRTATLAQRTTVWCPRCQTKR